MTDGAEEVTSVLVGDPSAPVAEIEIHRPPANYFDVALLTSLAQAVDDAAAGGARVAVVCSEGKHFCAGLDFGAAGRPDAESLRTLYSQARRLVSSPIPLVAAVQGSAVGGGFGLALACDFRVATPSTRFCANFSRLGFHPGFGISLTLPTVVGHQRALDLLTTGRRVGGHEALSLGLCDRLADDEPSDLRQVASELATELAGAAPLALQSIRNTLRGDLIERFGATVDHERLEQVRLMETADFDEGIAASLQRRSPRFNGR